MNARFAVALFVAVIGIFWGCLLATAPSAAADGDNNLGTRVKQLVEQLADPDEKKQAEAEGALLKLGPAILDHLPGPDAKLTKPQAERLQSVRTTLQTAQAQKDMAPSSVTLKEKGILLSKALEQLAQQTKNTVEDNRQTKDDDPRLNLDLDKVTFWQALDAIAREADLRIRIPRREGKITLMEGPYLVQPVCYSGIFRVAVKKVAASLDLEGTSHQLIVYLEIAWEPRFQPLFLDAQPDNLVAKDDKGLELKYPERGSGRGPISDRVVTEAQVRIEAPERTVGKLGLLSGNFTIIGPSKMLTFTFDHLAKSEKGKPPPKQTKDGVMVTMKDFAIEGEDRWKVELELEYPPTDVEFESFESWLVNNEIHLEKDAGKTRFPLNGSYEIDPLGGQKTAISYRFVEENDKVLGKPADWKLVYRTPGTIVKLPVKFEFKDLQLP